jgi:16S rRNA (guanine(966)-N(2))-methyltransferase RsmD
MRVIAGTYRSRHLAAPPGLHTRPTSDRLRETLFNVLAPRIQGAYFADLYAGSGAVGIEAISRDARHVYFAEKAAPAAAAIRANLKSLGITGGYTLLERSVMAMLQKQTQPLDIIFLDPPYEAEQEYTSILHLLGSNATQSFLTPQSIVIAEHQRRTKLADSYGRLARYRLLEQGDAALSFYKLNTDNSYLKTEI